MLDIQKDCSLVRSICHSEQTATFLPFFLQQANATGNVNSLRLISLGSAAAV